MARVACILSQFVPEDPAFHSFPLESEGEHYYSEQYGGAHVYSGCIGQRNVMNGAAGERSSRAQQADNCENGAHQDAGGCGTEQVNANGRDLYRRTAYSETEDGVGDCD